eukprot:CAMPEP_0202474448 /NCGR_PEP_ID=MMETSP1360-20130828/92390_1 /ASSEMBLY_ACC=CAM_ASM_000848 /TAXON_ID=515479 /ORGANISM="Licmophora paradoxa, Strain CCMP2313" /LENGTH=147 /DNA_ID=CAMNT_0049101575 /DNA_START=122 /DNA_END=565 /DNA_ORIENTATION=-
MSTPPPTTTNPTTATTTTHPSAAAATNTTNNNNPTTPTHKKLPVPPFSYQDAVQKVRMAEDAWNTRDPNKVKMAYTEDTKWRNRSTFLEGREQVASFLKQKWDREHNYRLIKELWAYSERRIAVRFAYEYQNEQQQQQDDVENKDKP